MATLTHKCPHCVTEHIALIIVHVTNPRSEKPYAHFECPKCHRPSAAKMSRIRGGGIDPPDWTKHSTDISFAWAAEIFWPAVPGPNLPDSLPENVARILLQAEHNYPINGNEEAAGTMYRKALDVGLKKIDPDGKGTLAVRIKKLAAEHKLTPALAEWSDHIRELGNDAAHEEEPPSREELTALRSFTEMVMRYLFTLPMMVEIRKAETILPRK